MYCQTRTILNRVQAVFPEVAGSMRLRILSWLNGVMQLLAADPIQWDCLKLTTTVAVSNNRVVLPYDFQKVIYIKQDGSFFLDESDQLTPKEAFSLTDVTGALPTGYLVDRENGFIQFFPGATGTIKMQYLAQVPEYTDSEEDTLFPLQFQGILVRACLDFVYEYNSDAREFTSYKLNQALLNDLLAWENNNRPLPETDGHYLRSR